MITDPPLGFDNFLPAIISCPTMEVSRATPTPPWTTPKCFYVHMGLSHAVAIPPKFEKIRVFSSRDHFILNPIFNSKPYL